MRTSSRTRTCTQQILDGNKTQAQSTANTQLVGATQKPQQRGLNKLMINRESKEYNWAWPTTTLSALRRDAHIHTGRQDKESLVGSTRAASASRGFLSLFEIV